MPVAPAKETLDPELFNVELEPHILTDKKVTKCVPCTECKRPCVVTTFMAPAKVKCKECQTSSGHTTGTQAVVQAGATNPAMAANLADCLLNPNFAHAVCPINGEHTMELKDVSHSPNYGPRHLLGYKDGIPQFKQETGETVMHQCLDCAATVSFSTQHPMQLRRQNESKQSARSGPSIYESILGVRES